MNTADLTSLTNTAALKPLRFQMLADLPVRAKLLLAFLAITAISASMIAFFSDRTTSAVPHTERRRYRSRTRPRKTGWQWAARSSARSARCKPLA